MTESEYWRDHQLINDEVNIAIETFYTYLEIHACAAEDRDVYRMLNKQPAFWNIQLYGLQSAFFIALGRIFDDGRDCLSVHKLLTATVAHPEFFSKQALTLRKSGGGPKPEWLDAYVVDVCEPQPSDLRNLKRALAPYRKKYDRVYDDIRDQVFAHKILREREHVSDLFSRTQINEIDDILYFLYDLMEALWNLFQNGRRPELGSRSYDYRQRIKNATRSVLQDLASRVKEEA